MGLAERVEGEGAREAPGPDGSATPFDVRLLEEEHTLLSGPHGPWPAQLCALRTRAEAGSRALAAARVKREAREAEVHAVSGEAEEAPAEADAHTRQRNCARRRSG